MFMFTCVLYFQYTTKNYIQRGQLNQKKKKNKDLKSQPKHMQMLQLTNKDFKITMICMLKKYKENSNID